MSLKAFHLVFITASCLLAFGFAAWEVKSYCSPESKVWDLVLGVGSFAAGVGLIFYERYFLRKLKNVSYL